MVEAKQEDVNQELSFNQSVKTQIEAIINNTVEQICKDKQYDPKTGQAVSNEIAEAIVKGAQDVVKKNFKAQCLAMILNKETSGFHMSASCYWDANNDGNINIKKDFPTFYVIVTFFGISRN